MTKPLKKITFFVAFLSNLLSIKAKKILLTNFIILGEAIHLARDFGYVCETEFPARQVAEYLSTRSGDISDQFRRKDLLIATK